MIDHFLENEWVQYRDMVTAEEILLIE